MALESTEPRPPLVPALNAIVRRPVVGLIAPVLDVAIACYALVLGAILLTGGFDFGWLSAREAAKPILVLWVLVPIRLALHSRPVITPSMERVATTVIGAVRSIAQRLPPSVRDVAFAVVVTRVGTVSVGFLVNLLFPADRTRPFSLPFERPKLAETFAAWDSGWYFDIALRGYYYSADGQSSIAFFPLYPMLMRALAWPFGSTEPAVWTAGILISWASFLLGLVVLHQFAQDLFGDRRIARRAVLYTCVFPFSLFLTRVYPTGLFFLLTVLAVRYATRSRWGLAGLCGGLAALTRPQGILIAVPLVLMALAGGTRRETLVRVMSLAPIGLAFLAFNVYIGALAGHPLAWLETETQWGYTLGHPPWERLLALLSRLERHGPYDYFFTSPLAAYQLFHGLTALFLVALVPSVFVRLGPALGAYVLISLLVPLSGSALEGIGRYATVLFPVFLVLATVKSPRFHEALLVVCSTFLALFVGLFVTWRPIY